MHSFTINACIRGFHVYSASWKPEFKENLNCFQEPKKMYNMYAVSTKENLQQSPTRNSVIFFRGDDVYREERIVGHLPKYISRFAWYFTEHGGEITAEVTGSPTFSRDIP